VSAFELPPEHVAALVRAGAALRIGRLPPLSFGAEADISSAAGQDVVFAALWDAHRTALVERYPTMTPPARPNRAPDVRIAVRADADLVQVLQWIRCYEYQTCGGRCWADSFARRYCALLTQAVIDALIDRHAPAWVFESTQA
jgi:hypothetical protein